ncbi:MAG: hypothetical protein WDW38_003300 [Sanguina aurantia]
MAGLDDIQEASEAACILGAVAHATWFIVNATVVWALTCVPSALARGDHRQTAIFAATLLCNAASFYRVRGSDPGWRGPNPGSHLYLSSASLAASSSSSAAATAAVSAAPAQPQDSSSDVSPISSSSSGEDFSFDDLEGGCRRVSSSSSCGMTRSCSACRVSVRPGTKHCRYCACCVEGFDHHCFFIGTCVGARNHSRFWWFLLCQTACIMYSLHLTIDCVVSDSFGTEALVWALLAFQAVCLTLIGCLLAFHSFLAWSNQTTRSVVSVMRGGGGSGGGGGMGLSRAGGGVYGNEPLPPMPHGLLAGVRNVVRFCGGGRRLRAWRPSPGTRALGSCVEGACDNAWYSCC